VTRLFSIIAGFVLLFAVPAFAGSLEIQKLQIRATAPGMKATGGYLTITNHGKADDALISASADFAGRVELHEMLMDGDVMKMRERKAGIAVPAGSTVMLKPGGLHLMLMGLSETMMPGERRDVTLTFRSGHSVTLPAMVMKPGEIGGHGRTGHNDNHN
jgi:copper(I)-binding protein